jgi:hypothetical protein
VRNDDTPATTWSDVPARVWIPNAVAGGIGGLLAGLLVIALLARYGVSRSAVGLVGEVTEFLRGQ